MRQAWGEELSKMLNQNQYLRKRYNIRFKPFFYFGVSGSRDGVHVANFIKSDTLGSVIFDCGGCRRSSAGDSQQHLLCPAHDVDYLFVLQRHITPINKPPATGDIWLLFLNYLIFAIDSF